MRIETQKTVLTPPTPPRDDMCMRDGRRRYAKGRRAHDVINPSPPHPPTMNIPEKLEKHAAIYAPYANYHVVPSIGILHDIPSETRGHCSQELVYSLQVPSGELT